jgi:predicted RNA binding protein YcfA (HicA-like mRNA interferase family)
MPSGEQVADYLIDEKQVQLGDCPPWPEKPLEDDEELEEINWSNLFPTKRLSPGDGNLSTHEGSLVDLPPDWRELGRDPWNPDLDRTFTKLIEETLGTGKPGDDASFGGWDICAWYQPVHFHGHDWGIFIREQCLFNISLQIAAFLDPSAVRGVPVNLLAKALLRAATCTLFLHEHFHHKVECLGIRLYVVEKKSRYVDYFRQIYRNKQDPDKILEEALANADSYNRISDPPYSLWLPPCFRDAVRTWMLWNFKLSPPGYDQAGRFINTAFNRGENRLHGYMHECTFTLSQPPSEWDFAPRLTQSFFNFDHHIWSVVRGKSGILPKAKTAPIRTCSSSEMVRLLEQVGYRVVTGGKGSHIKLEKPGAPMVVVPGNRRELSPGVAKNIVPVLGGRSLGHLQLYLQGTIPVGHRLS